MPIRPFAPSHLGADGKVNEAALADALDHLRKGTREQYESDWTLIPAAGSHSFDHQFEEIPWHVDVVRSEASDGARPASANAFVTVTKTSAAISVTNNAAVAYYFRVRAI